MFSLGFIVKAAVGHVKISYRMADLFCGLAAPLMLDLEKGNSDLTSVVYKLLMCLRFSDLAPLGCQTLVK